MELPIASMDEALVQQPHRLQWKMGKKQNFGGLVGTTEWLLHLYSHLYENIANGKTGLWLTQ